MVLRRHCNTLISWFWCYPSRCPTTTPTGLWDIISIYEQFEKIISIVGQKPLLISVTKSTTCRYQKERIFEHNDKNEKCLRSDSDMNKICKNSYWRTPRLFYWILSYLWAYNPVNLFLKKTVLIRNARRNIFETGISVRTPPT